MSDVRGNPPVPMVLPPTTGALLITADGFARCQWSVTDRVKVVSQQKHLRIVVGKCQCAKSGSVANIGKCRALQDYAHSEVRLGRAAELFKYAGPSPVAASPRGSRPPTLTEHDIGRAAGQAAGLIILNCHHFIPGLRLAGRSAHRCCLGMLQLNLSHHQSPPDLPG